MMKKFLPGALGALMVLASCSQNEVAEINRDGDEIRFNVVTNKATKAADVYCNNNMMESFQVTAITDGKTYIANDKIEKKGDSWVNVAGTRYWPETAVDFYAHVNAGTTFSCEKESEDENAGFVAKFENFKVEDEVANQKDLLYAVQKEKKKAEKEVTLNFRHALSQIVFQARNDSKNLYVVIEGVTVANVGNTNTFTFPSANTDENIPNHESHDENANSDGVYGDDELEGTINYDASWGTWADLTEGTSSYDVTFNEVAVKGDGELVSLTTANDNGKTFNGNAMLLLPQTTTAWDITAAGSQNTEGSYFLVNCRIYNVADADKGYQEGDVCLWGENTAEGWKSKPLAIPAAFDWDQGEKYVYTFVFGNGNGGYEPGEEENPDPVLVPITFEVTVDDFVPVDGRDIESGLPESGE